ncbi:MAG: hypothetical protein EOO73_24105 [Myxococcales bacterium]|nr:MAG: hypothetical protein EOO73_24105 [Myxococcales bacterium]
MAPYGVLRAASWRCRMAPHGVLRAASWRCRMAPYGVLRAALYQCRIKPYGVPCAAPYQCRIKLYGVPCEAPYQCRIKSYGVLRAAPYQCRIAAYGVLRAASWGTESRRTACSVRLRGNAESSRMACCVRLRINAESRRTACSVRLCISAELRRTACPVRLRVNAESSRTAWPVRLRVNAELRRTACPVRLRINAESRRTACCVRLRINAELRRAACSVRLRGGAELRRTACGSLSVPNRGVRRAACGSVSVPNGAARREGVVRWKPASGERSCRVATSVVGPPIQLGTVVLRPRVIGGDVLALWCARPHVEVMGRSRGGMGQAGSWGGRRVGAGRKRGSKPFASHGARPSHSPEHPVHVTLRVAGGVPSLRKKRAFRAVKRAFQLANSRSKHREDFRVTHYSVQGNHVHLVAEATDEVLLARGVQGLSVRIARRLNAELGRRGSVFARRYHARSLRTARAVRHVLAYVLLNEQRHLYQWRKLTLAPWYFDPCSSAAEFDGWECIAGLDPPPQVARDVTVAPRCALLKILWRRHGLIRSDEVPGAPELRFRAVA